MENNNLGNTPENQNEVNFSIDENITVVELKKENKDNKLPIILIICVLIIALISGILLFVFKSKEPSENNDITITEESSTKERDPFDDLYEQALDEVITDENGVEIPRDEYITQIQQQLQEATTLLNQDVGVTSPNQIVENTTSAKPGNVQTETTTANIQQASKAEAQIKAFLDRSCYIQGALYSENTGDPLSISFDGDNFEVLTNLDGTEISLMCLDGTMYIKRPALNQYIELTDTVLNLMKIDPATFNFSFDASGYEAMKSKLQGIYDITINGNPGVVYEYKGSEQSFKFYAENGNLKQIEIFDTDGTVVSQIAVTFFSESIPSDQLTLKGYTKSSLGAIFADLM